MQDMENLPCSQAESGEVSMAAYMALKPAGGEEGSFRFVLAGPNKLKVRFDVSKVLNSPHFEGMIAEAELAIGDQIRFEKNSACSTWVDIVDLVRSQDYMISDSDDNDVADEFLASLERCKKELQDSGSKSGDLLGISLRWMLGTLPGSKRVLLFAQVYINMMRNTGNSKNNSYPV